MDLELPFFLRNESPRRPSFVSLFYLRDHFLLFYSDIKFDRHTAIQRPISSEDSQEKSLAYVLAYVTSSSSSKR